VFIYEYYEKFSTEFPQPHVNTDRIRTGATSGLFSVVYVVENHVSNRLEVNIGSIVLQWKFTGKKLKNHNGKRANGLREIDQ
jgi:hypothetical protein